MSRRERWLRKLVRTYIGTRNELKKIGLSIPIGLLILGDFEWLATIVNQELECQ